MAFYTTRCGLFEEIKANPDQFGESVFHELGHKYCYWYPAEKKGYSGVAILSKIEPNQVSYGTGIDYMDAEGRNILFILMVFL